MCSFVSILGQRYRVLGVRSDGTKVIQPIYVSRGSVYAQYLLGVGHFLTPILTQSELANMPLERV